LKVEWEAQLSRVTNTLVSEHSHKQAPQIVNQSQQARRTLAHRSFLVLRRQCMTERLAEFEFEIVQIAVSARFVDYPCNEFVECFG
jgi:hypothetical protein